MPLPALNQAVTVLDAASPLSPSGPAETAGAAPGNVRRRAGGGLAVECR
jgi:hypothetical protein